MLDFRKVLEDIDNLKRKYESRISSLVSKELEEFKKEFGELPDGISIHSTRIDQVGSKSPYCLNIKTEINLGL